MVAVGRYIRPLVGKGAVKAAAESKKILRGANKEAEVVVAEPVVAELEVVEEVQHSGSMVVGLVRRHQNPRKALIHSDRRS